MEKSVSRLSQSELPVEKSVSRSSQSSSTKSSFEVFLGNADVYSNSENKPGEVDVDELGEIESLNQMDSKELEIESPDFL